MLGDVQHRVEAEQVGKEERAHRHRARLLDHLVDLLDVEALLGDGLPDLGGGRVEDAVHDEPGRLAAADRLLADLLGEVVGDLRRLLRGVLALDHLDQPHHRGGVEEVEAAHLVGTARGLPHLRDRQRRRVRGEDRVAGSDLVELGEHGLLDLHPLGHGLDHEVDVAEALVLGCSGDAAEGRFDLLLALVLADLLLLDQLPDLALGDLLGLLEAGVDELLLDVLQHDVDVRGGQHLGDLSTHGSGADHGGFENEHLEFLRRRWGRRRGPLTGAEGYKAACSAASVAKRRSVRASASFWARRMNRRSTSALSGPPTETLYASSSSTTVPSSSSVNVTRWVPSSFSSKTVTSWLCGGSALATRSVTTPRPPLTPRQMCFAPSCGHVSSTRSVCPKPSMKVAQRLTSVQRLYASCGLSGTCVAARATPISRRRPL